MNLRTAEEEGLKMLIYKKTSNSRATLFGIFLRTCIHVHVYSAQVHLFLRLSTA